MLSAAPCVHDARPRFAARALAGLGYDVTLLCRSTDLAPPAERVSGARVLRADFNDLAPLDKSRTLGPFMRLFLRGVSLLRRRFEKRGKASAARLFALVQEFWSIAAHGEALLATTPDRPVAVVHAVGLPALAAAGRIARRTGAALVYDAIELERDRNARYMPLFHHLRLRIERYWTRRADLVVTVSEEIALQLSRDYDIRRPAVVHNAAPLNLVEEDLRYDLDLPEDAPLAVYIGAGVNDRGIAAAIRAVGERQRFHLAVVGPEEQAFRARYRNLIAACGAQGLVHVAPIQRPDQAAGYIRAADVSIAAGAPTCASYAFALPNKLFQSVASATPVIVGRTPALRRMVTNHAVGECVDEREPAVLAAAMARQAARKGAPEYMAARADFLRRYNTLGAICDWARLYARLKKAPKL